MFEHLRLENESGISCKLVVFDLENFLSSLNVFHMGTRGLYSSMITM